jgi:hypothetical protein
MALRPAVCLLLALLTPSFAALLSFRNQSASFPAARAVYLLPLPTLALYDLHVSVPAWYPVKVRTSLRVSVEETCEGHGSAELAFSDSEHLRFTLPATRHEELYCAVVEFSRTSPGLSMSSTIHFDARVDGVRWGASTTLLHGLLPPLCCNLLLLALLLAACRWGEPNKIE